MRKCLIPGLLLLCSYATKAQNDFLADSLKKNLTIAYTDADKVNALTDLSTYYAGVDEKLSKSYGDQAMEVAELSRDRKLIATTWIKAGLRLLNKAGVANNMAIAMDCFQHAEKIARQNDLDEEVGFAYVGMARVARGSGDYAQALNYNNLALSLASASRNDSLKVTAFSAMGYTYGRRRLRKG
jgi:tetratricopeptide (TPR) repeat protein